MPRSLALLLAGTFSLCVLPPGVTGDDNLIICQSETDPVICNRRHEMASQLFAREEVELKFEGMIITCIKALDRWRDKTGGIATLKAGGLGQSSATVLLQGQFLGLRGYSFDVIVRGVPVAQEQTTPTTTIPPTIDMRTLSDSCFCVNSCERNIFDERIFVPSFDMN